jgi:hypothetical protein
LKLVFLNIRKGIVIAEDTPDPTVLAPREVRARAEKGQAVVVFRIDEYAERQALDAMRAQEYQDGLTYNHIEIVRVNRSDPTQRPVTVTPEGWLPRGLPQRYGAPVVPIVGPRSMFEQPVYIFAQRGGESAAERKARRELELEMERRMEEERRWEEERLRTMDREDVQRMHRERSRTTPTPGPEIVRPLPGTRVRTGVPAGWYHFVDRDVPPDARYEYQVIIYCDNPLFGSRKVTDPSKVPQIVKSDAVGAAETVMIESFKRWYFTGGTTAGDVETGTFKVRCFIGGRTELTPGEIAAIVAELAGGVSETPGTRAVAARPAAAETFGEWVEHNFQVVPGEEIGRRAVVAVKDEKREIDFGTGCQLVSLQDDVRVDEEVRKVPVEKNGGIQMVERVLRRTYPHQLRIAYLDRNGTLQTRYRESVPPLGGTPAPE